MTIGNAAIHAARALLRQGLIGRRNHKLTKMTKTRRHLIIGVILPLNLQKSRHLTHDAVPHCCASWCRLSMPVHNQWA